MVVVLGERRFERRPALGKPAVQALDDVLRVVLGRAERELAHPEEEVGDQEIVEELRLPACPPAQGQIGRPQRGLGMRLLKPLAG
jgi:hypothetical protein